MRKKPIQLTAYREVEERWRIKRLRNVAAECPTSVLALHDHKGALAVNWSAAPSLREITAVAVAWGNENEMAHIDHFVRGDAFDVEVFGHNPFAKALRVVA
jgi:hypothetical protein